MGLRSGRPGGKQFVGDDDVVGCGLSSLVWHRQTYGSNSAGSRDGADGAGALSEGVSEHIERLLYVPGVKKGDNCN